MSIKVEQTDNKNEVKLTFTVEAEKFEEGIKTVFNKNAKYFNIPGFRKGKAPIQIVEKYYGTQIFYEDAFNEVVPEIFDKEIKENKIEAVSRPDIDIVQMEKGKDLIFTAVVQTKPEVKLGKYKEIPLKKIEYKVTEKDVDDEINKMAEQNSRLVTIEDRPVEDKDIVTIDFKGTIDGVAFDGGTAEGQELTIGSKTFIPGFEEQVIGMKLEEEKDLKVTFPEEYFSKDLAGKDAVFHVKLHAIKKKELPKIDDEFAKDVSEFDTIKDLKNSIKEKLEHENKHRAEHETEDAAIDAVCQNTNIDIPSGMVEGEIDHMIEDINTRLSYQGLTLDQYLQMLGKTQESLRAEFKETAEKNVKTSLVLEAIVKAENIKADKKEVEEKLKEMSEQYKRDIEELKKNEELNKYIEQSIQTQKAISFVVDNAKIK